MYQIAYFLSSFDKMETQATSVSSSTERKYSPYSIHDPPGYIDPSLQDMLFTDITAKGLVSTGQVLDVEYLSSATSFPGSFPVDGEIYGMNNRLMINLVCRRRERDAHPINIIFLIDTGSPASYLSEMAMKALIGDTGANVPHLLKVMVHSNEVIQCYLSPPDKHFAYVNVLGMDFLVANRLTLKVNSRTNICTLMIEENE